MDTSKLSSHAQEYCRRWFKIGLWDFRAGHVISFFLVCIFMLLAAVWLFPSEVQGNAVMGEIARIFTDSVGPGMMIVFLVGAMAATYSTAFNYFDGWPRVVGACCRNLFPATADLRGTAREDLGPEHLRRWYSEYNIYRISMLFSLVTSVAIIAGLPRPVLLVLVASALAYFVAPGDFLPQPLLLLHDHPQGRQGLLSIDVREVVRLVEPGGLHGNVAGTDLAATRASGGGGLRRVGNPTWRCFSPSSDWRCWWSARYPHCSITGACYR